MIKTPVSIICFMFLGMSNILYAQQPPESNKATELISEESSGSDRQDQITEAVKVVKTMISAEKGMIIEGDDKAISDYINCFDILAYHSEYGEWNYGPQPLPKQMKTDMAGIRLAIQKGLKIEINTSLDDQKACQLPGGSVVIPGTTNRVYTTPKGRVIEEKVARIWVLVQRDGTWRISVFSESSSGMPN